MENPMKLHNELLLASILLSVFCGFGHSSTHLQQGCAEACANDYHRHCPQYGIETEALRLCMDKAGHALSKTCVDALVDAGEVSKAEVERRKRSGR
jgi:hypothetical protein